MDAPTRRRNDIKRALIVIADPDPFDMQLLEQVAVDAGHLPLTAADSDQLLSVLAREAADWIFIAEDLAPQDGLETLKLLRDDGLFSAIPVTLMSEDISPEATRKALELGAAAVLRKPLATLPLRRMVARLPHLGQAGYAIGRTEEQFPELPLTALGTASQLAIALDYELTRAVRYKRPLGCLVLHVADGRTADTRIAEFVRSSVRTLDHVFESEAGQLVVLLPETDIGGTTVVTERLEAQLQAHAPDEGIHLTFAVFPQAGTSDPKAFLERAQTQNIRGRSAREETQRIPRAPKA